MQILYKLPNYITIIGGKDIYKAPAEEYGLISYCAYYNRAWDSILLLVFFFSYSIIGGYIRAV